MNLFLTVRTSFGWPGYKLPDNRREVWTEHPLARHICARTGHPHIARTDVSLTARTRVAANTAQDCALWCLLKRSRDPSVMSHMLPHSSQNTSTRSLSPTSPIFRPSSPSLSCPQELDQETLRDSRRSGGSTNSAPPTGDEPKVVQSDDFEPRRTEHDRNLETDPYQITERILGDHYQKSYHRRYGGNCVDMHYVQSRIHSDYDSAESVADSDLEDGELRQVVVSPLYVHGRGENYSSSHKPTPSRREGQVHNVLKLITLEERELEVKFISRATSVWETGCSVFNKEQRSGKPAREFYFEIC